MMMLPNKHECQRRNKETSPSGDQGHYWLSSVFRWPVAGRSMNRRHISVRLRGSLGFPGSPEIESTENGVVELWRACAMADTLVQIPLHVMAAVGLLRRKFYGVIYL